MKRLLAAAAFAALSIAPAYAQFAGPYVGAAATMDNVHLTGDFEGLGATGIGGTAFAGYDINMGGAFVGVEGNIDLNTADIDDIAEAKWGWGVSGRLGFTVNKSTGVYGRVGYQRNKVEVLGFSDWGDGVRFGGGVETAIATKAALRLEFSHVDYEQDVANNQFQAGVLFRF